MSSQQNIVTIRRALAAVSERNLDGIQELVAPDFVCHDHNGIFCDARESDGFVHLVRLLLGALLDLHLEMGEVLATDDRAVVYLSTWGTHQGELFGVRPTGQSVHFDSVDLYRLQGGQIAEVWPLPDLAGIRRQMAELAG